MGEISHTPFKRIHNFNHAKRGIYSVQIHGLAIAENSFIKCVRCIENHKYYTLQGTLWNLNENKCSTITTELDGLSRPN